MPRLALLSDVHGNLDALVAALRAIEREAPDALAFLGDAVGYGPEPEACIGLLARTCDALIVGNHDEAALEPDNPPGFKPAAAASMAYTRRRLDDEHLSILADWPRRASLAGVSLAHGSFGRRPFAYVTGKDAAIECFTGLDASVGVIGHTHVPAIYARPSSGQGPDHFCGRTPLPSDRIFNLIETKQALLNPGSIGQPRDRNPDAAWGLLDTDARTFRIRRTPYDIDRVKDKIRDAGLPDLLGNRLAIGA